MPEQIDEQLFHPRHAARYLGSMTAGLQHLSSHLADVDRPSTGASPADAAARVAAIDLDAPLHDTAAALEELSRLWLDDAVWFHEPGYVAHLNCPVAIPALLGELLLSSVNTSLDTFDQSVGATFMERELVAWTCGRVGWPTGETTPDGVFTSGGSQSNLQGLLLAREQARAAGVPAARMRILASAECHFSIQKSARLLGLSDQAVVPVETDAEHRLDVVAMERALHATLADGGIPVAIVATAGTTDFGAIDPLDAIADLARRHHAWLHVDAAYGGGLLVSPGYGHLLAGIEHADSVTVDYHKTWFQPVSSSALLVRDGSTLRHVTLHADYLNPAPVGGTTSPNQVDKSLQTTRRFDALKLWLTLRITGARAVGEGFDRVIDLARDGYDELRARPDIEVAAAPRLSTLVFRHAPAGVADLDAHNRAIRQALWDDGNAIVAATRVDGVQFLKFTLLNPLTTLADLVAVIDRICAVGTALATDAEDLIEVAG